MVGTGSLAEVTEVVPLALGGEVAMPCPRCVDPAMQPLRITGADATELWHCNDCRGWWLPEGAFFDLKRAFNARRTVAPRTRRPISAPPVQPARLAHSRSRHDVGVENLVAVPVALLLSYLFCSTLVGRMMGSLVGMPFHELGHAAASWLSSRVAIPLPFFTVWYDEQSVLMGGVVAGALLWLGYHAYREDNRFALGTAIALLTTQAIVTLALPARLTLMWQILSGALAELVFGAFLLVAFHFPAPDRFRWDFWRWLAIIPGALCFVQAMRLWSAAVSDSSRIPWGSALGAESDGDMNRLVQQFDWTANELARFYASTGYVCLAALVVAYAHAVWRQKNAEGVPAVSR